MDLDIIKKEIESREFDGSDWPLIVLSEKFSQVMCVHHSIPSFRSTAILKLIIDKVRQWVDLREEFLKERILKKTVGDVYQNRILEYRIFTNVKAMWPGDNIRIFNVCVALNGWQTSIKKID